VIGKRVNNFDITRLLGEGGMGAVYEATHSIIPRRVAIKVLRREYAVDSALVQRFFNEARATHAIRHPNIVEIIDVGMLPEGVPYLIMELLEGESLAHRVGRDGKLDLVTAVDFVLQVADALETAHAAGIVHRDVKPDHLFLVKNEKQPERELVKVLDFGIAKLRANLLAGKVTTNAGTILGTPAYMSPEQCRGVAEGVDHRADVYALGITLYELICGIPPFIGKGIGDVMMLHMGVAPEAPSRRRSEVPPELDAVVLKALAKAPDDRFQSMSEMADALRAYLGTEPPVRPRPVKAAAPALFRPSPRNSTPSNLSVQSTAQASGWSKRTTLIALGSLVLVGLGGQAVLRQNGTRPVSALENDSLDQQNLRLRGESGAAAGAAPVASGSSGPAARASSTATAPSSPSVAASPATASPATASPATASPASAAPVAPSPSVVPDAPAAPPATAARPPVASASSVARTEPALTAAEGSGFLSLDSVPWANVYVGNRMLGTTPLDRVPLPAGRQALRLENPELEAATEYVVQIESGRLVTRFVDWAAQRAAPSAAP
jgi:eukaryotic-like serine/threonine-protein kinase